MGISTIPPDYQCDYFLYLATTISTIVKVFVQEDDIGTEHPIYYMSQNLNDIKIRYTQVQKLDLVAIQAIQRFHHYILI